MGEPAGAERHPADAGNGGDDIVLAFRTVLSRAQGRIVRLGHVTDDILSRHDYPDSVSRTLGEAIALSAMLGSLLHADGRLILQTRTDGPLRMLVVDYTSPGNLRAMASFDADQVAALEAAGHPGQGHLLGTGHLAMTIDAGAGAPRSQGIVALANHALAQAAHTYFRQSEQIPTFVRLAVARHQVRGDNGSAPAWHWRAGGLIVQQLPEDVGTGGAVGNEADDDNLVGDRDEDWQRTRMLAATVEDHELLDPTLPPEQLLLRLFAQEGVTVTPPIAIKAHCSCTRQRVEHLLQGFGADEMKDMREPDGGVTVTCEYCSKKYRFTPDELTTL